MKRTILLALTLLLVPAVLMAGSQQFGSGSNQHTLSYYGNLDMEAYWRSFHDAYCEVQGCFNTSLDMRGQSRPLGLHYTPSCTDYYSNGTSLSCTVLVAYECPEGTDTMQAWFSTRLLQSPNSYTSGWETIDCSRGGWN